MSNHAQYDNTKHSESDGKDPSCYGLVVGMDWCYFTKEQLKKLDASGQKYEYVKADELSADSSKKVRAYPVVYSCPVGKDAKECAEELISRDEPPCAMGMKEAKQISESVERACKKRN